MEARKEPGMDDQALRRYIHEREQIGLPVAIKKLRLQTPEDFGGLIDELGINIRSHSGGKKDLARDMTRMLFISACFDVSDRDQTFELTRKSWGLMEKADEVGGEPALRRALLAMTEKADEAPRGFRQFIRDGHKAISRT